MLRVGNVRDSLVKPTDIAYGCSIISIIFMCFLLIIKPTGKRNFADFRFQPVDNWKIKNMLECRWVRCGAELIIRNRITFDVNEWKTKQSNFSYSYPQNIRCGAELTPLMRTKAKMMKMASFILLCLCWAKMRGASIDEGPYIWLKCRKHETSKTHICPTLIILGMSHTFAASVYRT